MRYVVPLFFFCLISFAQTNDSLGNKKVKTIYDFSLKMDSLSSKVKPNFSNDFKINKGALISVYDCNKKLNDIYCFSKDSIYFVKTVSLNSCQFAPKDSFNPHGASNIGVGLIMGSINTVLSSVFKIN